MRTVSKRLTPRRPSGTADRSRRRRPAEDVADATNAERRTPLRVRAATAELGTREACAAQGHVDSDAAAASENKKEDAAGARMLLCKLTDLELSGAPQLATREADRGRPTRPLERLVMRHVTHGQVGAPGARCNSDSLGQSTWAQASCRTADRTGHRRHHRKSRQRRRLGRELREQQNQRLRLHQLQLSCGPETR